MQNISKKLKLNRYEDIYIINKPDNFNEVFKNVNYSESLVTTSCVTCALVFVESKEEFVEQMSTLFPRLLDASILWVFYPKHTSLSDISKLHIEYDWDFLGDYRLRPTRLLTIDATWNAIKIKKIIH